MELNSKSFESISEYIIHFLCLFAPGLIILEMIFNIGLLHAKLTSIYDLILFLLWSLIISYPFQIIANFINKDDFPADKQFGRFHSMFELPFFIIIAFLICMLFQIAEHFRLPWTDILGISIKFLRFIISFTVGFLIAWPLSFLYNWVVRKMDIVPMNH